MQKYKKTQKNLNIEPPQRKSHTHSVSHHSIATSTINSSVVVTSSRVSDSTHIIAAAITVVIDLSFIPATRRRWSISISSVIVAADFTNQISIVVIIPQSCRVVVKVSCRVIVEVVSRIIVEVVSRVIVKVVSRVIVEISSRVIGPYSKRITATAATATITAANATITAATATITTAATAVSSKNRAWKSYYRNHRLFEFKLRYNGRQYKKIESMLNSS